MSNGRRNEDGGARRAVGGGVPRHDYILLFCYSARRISFVGGVQVVGIPSTHWFMGEGGRMPEGTLYTADNTFLIILRRF